MDRPYDFLKGLKVTPAPLAGQGGGRKRLPKFKFSAFVSLMDEFNLIDLWRNEHPTLRENTQDIKEIRLKITKNNG